MDKDLYKEAINEYLKYIREFYLRLLEKYNFTDNAEKYAEFFGICFYFLMYQEKKLNKEWMSYLATELDSHFINYYNAYNEQQIKSLRAYSLDCVQKFGTTVDYILVQLPKEDKNNEMSQLFAITSAFLGYFLETKNTSAEDMAETTDDISELMKSTKIFKANFIEIQNKKTTEQKTKYLTIALILSIAISCILGFNLYSLNEDYQFISEKYSECHRELEELRHENTYGKDYGRHLALWHKGDKYYHTWYCEDFLNSDKYTYHYTVNELCDKKKCPKCH